MAVTVDGLEMRLGIADGSAHYLSTLITDVETAVKLLANVRRIPSKFDALIYDICMDVYRLRGYGTSVAPSVVKKVTEDKKSVEFSGGSVASIAGTSIGELISQRHASALRRIRRANW